jgi:tetratricopeptide (TPR) repeat protein
MRQRSSRKVVNRFLAPIVVACVLITAGCGGGQYAEVTPEEIPQLEEQLAQDPDNGDLILRYAAALYAAGQCDTARTAAVAGMRLQPQSAIGPLVTGQCLELDGEYDQAIAVYREFLARYPDRPGAPAVRAREMFAVRERATVRARNALAREAALTEQPADLQTLAVLPIDIAGDSSYQPLSRGLAEMMTADLALLERFRMVERLEVSALIDEMQLADAGQVDRATAARMGPLLQAGQMVQGLAAIPPQGDVRLEATVVRLDGQVLAPQVATGSFRDLIQLEKEIVAGIADELGYTLSESERRALLENGTQNLAAFLAYSNGLLAEDLGNYAAAAGYFAAAVRADPGFSGARDRHAASAAAPAVQQASAGEVTQVAGTTVTSPEFVPLPLADAMASTMGDIAATQAEQNQAGSNTQQTVQQATTTTAALPPPTITQLGQSIGTIRVIIPLP